MQVILGFILLSFSLFAQVNNQCDESLLKTLKAKFNRDSKERVHRCLHIQKFEKVVTIVEPKEDQGALSLLVFEEKNLSPSSQAISEVRAFATAGLHTLPSSGEGRAIEGGLQFFDWPQISGVSGILALEFQNENSVFDLSFLRLSKDGAVDNLSFQAQDQDNSFIGQTANMDLVIFKVDGTATVDILPKEGLVVIGDKDRPLFRDEIQLTPAEGSGRMPAGQ
ncbi:MAG: hypothetical protein KDD33_07270 [Bdellovibrionales bacterium]|nr:hypothetical protein [Bdellovibrionales bacterium]